MPEPPLAAASERLRQPPGRPRTRSAAAPPAPRVALAHVVPLRPRLLDRTGAAAYLAVSLDVIDALDAAGVLRRVRLPGPGGADLRRVLYALEDVDGLINVGRETGSTNREEKGQCP